jgi:hypothetical protein
MDCKRGRCSFLTSLSANGELEFQSVYVLIMALSPLEKCDMQNTVNG